ncbi:MAG: ABC transporter transmembrane domain-containing protein, partial [Planctomycetota bacterium]
MLAFFKAVRHSLKYPWTILGAFLCSLMVAIIWSASITTVFPLVKIVMEGETAKTWVQNEIEDGDRIITSIHSEIETMESDLRQDPDSRYLQGELATKKKRLAAEQEALQWFQKIQPFVDRYAPDSPFQTLAYALAGLLTITFVKGILLVLGAILDARVSEKTVLDLRRIYYRKALEMDQRRIENMGASNMMTHLSYNMTMISSGLRMFYGKCLREPLKLVTSLAVAAYISLPLLVISLIIVPAGLYIIHSVS